MYQFTPQLEIGQSFEQSFANLLEIKGWSVTFNEGEYEDLKTCDLKITKNGLTLWVELKKDLMSQKTGNVCVEIKALSHSKAPILVYGLPTPYWTDIYKMPLKTMLQYAIEYPVKKWVGSPKVYAALIPKDIFTSLPFVRRFSLDEPLNPYMMSPNNSVAPLA
jgi:hypothetical protein